MELRGADRSICGQKIKLPRGILSRTIELATLRSGRQTGLCAAPLRSARCPRRQRTSRAGHSHRGHRSYGWSFRRASGWQWTEHRPVAAGMDRSITVMAARAGCICPRSRPRNVAWATHRIGGLYRLGRPCPACNRPKGRGIAKGGAQKWMDDPAFAVRTWPAGACCRRASRSAGWRWRRWSAARRRRGACENACRGLG